MSKEGYKTAKYQDIFANSRYTCIYLMVNDSLMWYCDKYQRHLGMQVDGRVIVGCSFYDRDGLCAIEPNSWEAMAIQKEAREKAEQKERVEKEKAEKEKLALKLIANLTEKIQLDPENGELYVERGLLYTQKEDFTLAMDDINEALRLNPKNAEAYESRGMVYTQKKEYYHAISDFTKAIQLNPNSKNAYKIRGAAYNLRGEYNKSIADYEYALRLDRNDTLTAVALENAKKNKRLSIKDGIKKLFWSIFGVVLGGIAGGLLLGFLSVVIAPVVLENNSPIRTVTIMISMIGFGLWGRRWGSGFRGCVGCLGGGIGGSIAVLLILFVLASLTENVSIYIPIGIGTIAGAVTGYFIVRDRI